MIHPVSIGFTSPIVDETSYSAHVREEEAYSTMEFFFHPRSEMRSFDAHIIWETNQGDYVEIGLRLADLYKLPYNVKWKATLEDYDGVFSLPRQAVELIEAAGIHVDDEFKDWIPLKEYA